MYINEKALQYSQSGEGQFKSNGQNITLSKRELGELYLPTGKIVANDPFFCYENEPFTVAVKPGSYPVAIFITEYPSDKRIALASLNFSGELPIRWELAITEQEELDQKNLTADEFYGYGVDSATGCFCDKAVIDMMANDENYDLYAAIGSDFDASYDISIQYLLTTIFDYQLANITCFTSGWGDGSYPSYFGFDGQGDPCCLVTDFCIIDNTDDR